MERSLQELFDISVRGLLKQNCRSMNVNRMACAYRGENGTKCAIGFLIPDDKYSKDFESIGLSNSFKIEANEYTKTIRKTIFEIIGADTTEKRNLAIDLQLTHDDPLILIEQWPSRFRIIAGKFRLLTSVIDNYA